MPLPPSVARPILAMSHMTHTSNATPPPTAGALGERYAIERELGRGGMATVYLAEERKHHRKVAVKVLRPDFAATLGAERFLREVAIAARLSHPHVVPLIDSGEADGLLFYVSPYAPGGSLRDRLAREGRLSLRSALRIAREVGSGLDFAHRAGFVHRDVKPENILFADEHAMLADFGVARVRGASENPTLAGAVTEAGVALGTPVYMSPEQAAGESALDGASDLYSLACVVYEMLAGEPPFHGGGARATMIRHITEAPRPLGALRAELSSGVEHAVAKALAKDPAQRYPSVADFVRALGDALSDTEPASARLTRAAAQSIAVLPFVNASPDPGNEYLSDGITDELIDALTKLEGLRVASRTSVFALKGKALDVRSIGAMLGAAVVLEGTVRKAGDRLRVTAQLTSTDDGRLLWSQRYDRELEDVFVMQDELARTIVTTLRGTWLAELGEPEPQRRTESVKAYGLYLRGRWALNKRTQAGVNEGIAFFEQAIAEDPRYALAYTGLADAYALLLDYRSVPVAEGFAQAKANAQRALALDDTLAEAHASLAWTLFIHEWKWAEAEREFRRAIELDPRYAAAHQWYSFLLVSQGRHEEALVAGHTAQELDTGSVSIRRTLGLLYYYARRFERARHHLAHAMEMNPVAEETYRVLGLVLALSREHREAERVLREAVTMPEAGSYTAATLAYALAGGGDRAGAESILRDLVGRSEREYVSPTALATAYLGLGDHARALDSMERVYAERRGWLVYVHVNPIFDPLRDEPRFKELQRKMGVPR